MGAQVFQKKHFKVYRAGKDGVILHNTKKDFSEAHTHLYRVSTARTIIDAVIGGYIPSSFKDQAYLLESLIRVSECPNYQEQCKFYLATAKLKKNGQ